MYLPGYLTRVQCGICTAARWHAEVGLLAPLLPHIQVRHLYGPLLACVTASKSAYEAMIRQHSPDGTSPGFLDKIRADPDSREGAIYR